MQPESVRPGIVASKIVALAHRIHVAKIPVRPCRHKDRATVVGLHERRAGLGIEVLKLGPPWIHRYAPTGAAPQAVGQSFHDGSRLIVIEETDHGCDGGVRTVGNWVTPGRAKITPKGLIEVRQQTHREVALGALLKLAGPADEQIHRGADDTQDNRHFDECHRRAERPTLVGGSTTRHDGRMIVQPSWEWSSDGGAEASGSEGGCGCLRLGMGLPIIH
ncbi:MAG: hypothetical protein DCC66_06580 [Planctomycetota bacterium]|nr:MAG: hypothetical protein DCC66_06580 [Planctomycetota bacterium]